MTGTDQPTQVSELAKGIAEAVGEASFAIGGQCDLGDEATAEIISTAGLADLEADLADARASLRDNHARILALEKELEQSNILVIQHSLTCADLHRRYGDK